jgi:biofilm PGA synthesis N-glycosyltransferase PgaC
MMAFLTAILFVLFLAAGLVQLFFWLGVFSKMFGIRQAQEVEKNQLPPVSVLICARNEATNLQSFLPAILRQDYPQFEVVVVDDASTDQTARVIRDLQQSNAHLRYIFHDRTGSTPIGKKAPLSQGIQSARHSFLLLTDADCRPVHTHWIRQMVKPAKGREAIVLGYGPYMRENTWLNRWIRFETVYTALQYFGFGARGIPYMGVGRNLLYTRSVYESAGGFQSHKELASGDDDLLINAVATKANTCFQLHPESFVYSIPKKSWRAYFRQKNRHFSTGVRYRPIHQRWLGALALSQVLFLPLAIGLIVAGMWKWVLGAYGLRWMIQGYVFGKACARLQEERLAHFYPVFDLCLSMYYILFTPAVFFPSKKTWG